jgi:hypothetical protein
MTGIYGDEMGNGSFEKTSAPYNGHDVIDIPADDDG